MLVKHNFRMEEEVLRKKYDWRRKSPCPLGPGNHNLKNQEISYDLRFWLGKSAINGASSTRKLASHFNLSIAYIQRSSKAVQEWPIVFNKRGGQSLLSESQIDGLKHLQTENGNNMGIDKVEEIVLNMAKQNIETRGHHDYLLEKVSDRSMGRILAKANLKTGQANANTKAREKACSDQRNACSFAAMIGHVNNVIPHYGLKLNVDATQFALGDDSKKKHKVVYAEKSRALKADAPTKAEGITSFFIKDYILLSAFGIAASPIYIIASDKMPKDQIDVYTVHGLGTTSQQIAYVVFVQARHPLIRMSLSFQLFTKDISERAW